MVFSRQILKRLPGFFFLFNIIIFTYVSKYETIETHARAFLALIPLAIAGVTGEDRDAGKALTISSRALAFIQSKSLYKSRAGRNFYGKEYEIWADFGPVGNTEKNILGPL